MRAILKTNPFDEANSVRAAEAYAKEGILTAHGLPRVLYGTRFLEAGTAAIYVNQEGKHADFTDIATRNFPPRLCTKNAWVYTHYPNLPYWICGLQGSLFGFTQLWLWRIFPIVVSISCAAFFISSLRVTLGDPRGLTVAIACLALPLVWIGMSAISYEGYATSFLMLEIGILMRLIWGGGSAWTWELAGLFVVGLLQGLTSFEYFFITAGAAWPLWELRRSENQSLKWSALCFLIILPCAGFCLGHFLHFLQVVGELGLTASIREFSSTATDRASQGNFLLGCVLATLVSLHNVIKLNGAQFGPLFVAAIAGAACVLTMKQGRKGMVGSDRFQIELFSDVRSRRAALAAILVSFAWFWAMPYSVLTNMHLAPRILFFLYFCLALIVVRNARIIRITHNCGTD